MASSRRTLSVSLGMLGFWVVVGVSACSVINAPDDVIPGTGSGQGGEGTGAGTDGGGGAAPACDSNDDCASLTTECATGECQGNVCVTTPQPADTPCGPTPMSECDLADACDGAGTCVASSVPDGTFCDDCPAGPGNCKLCQQGACEDCTDRAIIKTFRSPVAASGWTLTGDWKIYAETPPSVFGGPIPPQCSDGIDNDGDMLVDFPADPSCVDADDPFEFQISACNDAFDNDGDMLIDLLDPDCDGPGDDTEEQTGPIRFARPALGTDGNRAHPYGQASELEISSATSPPTVLPDTLMFNSWHIDEGAAYDLKAVQVSSDGVSFTTVDICVNGMPGLPYCDFVQTRDPDDWDMISIPVPPQFVGQVGYVRFLYDTSDGCCSFERGWYVDALNFAQDCACTAHEDCAYLTQSCGMGSCDFPVDECAITPENLGASCPSPTTGDCSDPTCDSNGWCASGFLPFEGDSCASCVDGPGLCQACFDGFCANCPAVQTFYYNADYSAWTFAGDWGAQSCVQPNSVTPNESPCFPFSNGPGDLLTYPMLGNDGSRTGAFPWAGQGEVENASVLTGPTVIPATLTFKSWHQDRGGNDTFMLRDKKTISVSVDGGMIFQTLVDCDGNMTIPFCQPSPPFQNRSLTAWDDISINVPANLVGQEGIFRFTYDTVDSGQGWERGWYIDDINIARCDIF